MSKWIKNKQTNRKKRHALNTWKDTEILVFLLYRKINMKGSVIGDDKALIYLWVLM